MKDETENQTQELPDAEEAADFARVEAMAAGGEPAPGSQPEPEVPEVPKMDATESLTGLLSLVHVGANMGGLPSVAAVWTPDACGQLAGATVPVLRKYPWGARVLDFLESGTGAEEAVLIAVAFGLGQATWKAYKADTTPKPADPPAPRQPSPAPRAETARPPAAFGELVEVTGNANG